MSATPEELTINSEVVCHYDGCKRIFRNSSALQMHLVKKHNVRGPFRYAPQKDSTTGLYVKEANSRKQLYCPIDTCCRGRNSGKPFNKLGNVKQHFHSVHGEKRFACGRCNKKFGLSDVCKRHEVECGLTFQCSCKEIFRNRAALLSHAKRNEHQLPLAFRNKSRLIKNQQEITSSTTAHQAIVLTRPVGVMNIHFPVHVDSSTVSTQTTGFDSCDLIQWMPSPTVAVQSATTESQIDTEVNGSVISECLTQTQENTSMTEHATEEPSLAAIVQAGEEWMPTIDIGIQTLVSDQCAENCIVGCDSSLEDQLLSSVGSQTDITWTQLFGDDLQLFSTEVGHSVSTQTWTTDMGGGASEMTEQLMCRST